MREMISEKLRSNILMLGPFSDYLYGSLFGWSLH